MRLVATGHGDRVGRLRETPAAASGPFTGRPWRRGETQVINVDDPFERRDQRRPKNATQAHHGGAGVQPARKVNVVVARQPESRFSAPASGIVDADHLCLATFPRRHRMRRACFVNLLRAERRYSKLKNAPPWVDAPFA